MYNLEDFQVFTKFLSENVALVEDIIHPHVVGLLNPDTGEHLCRLILMEDSGEILVSFNINTEPSDAALIILAAKKILSDIKIGESFYESNGRLFVGINAHVMREQDRDNVYREGIRRALEAKKDQLTPELRVKIDIPVFEATHPDAQYDYEAFKEHIKYRETITKEKLEEEVKRIEESFKRNMGDKNG